MQIDVHGRNLDVTPPLREYVEKRLRRLERFFTRECTFDIELSVEKNPRIADAQVAEATLVTGGHTIRARHAAPDMYAAIDGLADRVRRQAADLHDRAHTHHASKPATILTDDAAEPPSAEQPA